MKRLFCILLSLLCLLAACTTGGPAEDSSAGSDSLPAETSSAPPTRRYVALGDSIERGYGLDDPETQAYPALLRDRMQSYSEVEYANYAVDGQTSAGLLELLSNGGAPMLDGADVAGESLYFLAPALTNNHWIMENKTFVMRIGAHWFYR